MEYPKVEPNVIEIKKNTSSLILQIGQSESSGIDNLRYSGLFEQSTYLNEPIIYGNILNGRHRCSFVTKLDSKEVSICGAQYETDACYESANKVLLIEAKTGLNKSFNIRQLYYPFRAIYDNILNKKEIIILYINTDLANITHIWKFIFEDPLRMTSIRCIQYNKYTFNNF